MDNRGKPPAAKSDAVAAAIVLTLALLTMQRVLDGSPYACLNAGSATTRSESLRPLEFRAPITITKGGRFTGNWESTTADTPAVVIDTAERVELIDSSLRGSGDLIRVRAGGDVTVRNTSGQGFNPNVDGKQKGRFLKARRALNIVVENCHIEDTAGIYILEGKHVAVIRNSFVNIDGRRSNGAHGYQAADVKSDFVQAVQLDKVKGGKVEIAWNQIINEPGKSRVEDNISIYDSLGTPDEPIRIHNNYVQGAYPVSPAADTYSGGGIMLSDHHSAYVRAHDNHVVGTGNYGIAIYSGHHNEIVANRVISSGRLPNGARIFSQNVGVYIWNGKDDPLWGNNSGRDNFIGWAKGASRNDWWTPDDAGWTNNTRFSGPIPLAAEQAEFKIWQKKLAAKRVTVGRPQRSSTSREN